MSWISVDDQLPENNTLCWAYIPNKGIILRLFSCDGFGLGDDDYDISYWMKFTKPQKPSYTYHESIQLPTSQVWSRRVVDFEGLRQHLGR